MIADDDDDVGLCVSSYGTVYTQNNNLIRLKIKIEIKIIKKIVSSMEINSTMRESSNDSRIGCPAYDLSNMIRSPSYRIHMNVLEPFMRP